MSRFLMKLGLLVVPLALAGAACSSSSSPPTSSPQASSSSSESPAAIPTAKTISQPVVYGFYDGHVDAMLSTDVSSKAQATADHINFSPALTTQPMKSLPTLYMFKGHAAPGQPVVFGSEPGESDYSPLWDEEIVRWKSGVTPALLKSDTDVDKFEGKGQLTETNTHIVLNCPIVKVTASHSIPSSKTISQPVVYGYYDAHVDAMLSTDVSSKAQAAAQHINYSAALATRPANAFPFLYLISGPAAPNQPVVFGSEPGESDYSPLWDQVTVKWKPGVTPVLLVKDDQIKALAASGKLTMTPTPVVLNCPIVKVGNGGS